MEIKRSNKTIMYVIIPVWCFLVTKEMYFQYSRWWSPKEQLVVARRTILTSK